MAPQRRDPLENFYSHVWMVDDGCWHWTGAYREDYGIFSLRETVGSKTKSYPAHMWAYIKLVGPVPEGLELDHLCRKPSCVNPKHLEPVTHRENNRRSNCPSGLNSRKTHCLNGHELTGENLYTRQRVLKSGETVTHRACNTCQKVRTAACLARKRSEA